MTATYKIAADARAGAGDAASGQAAAPYVLNLCSSTTPMALAQTDLAELKRFNFFVSRRFEEGRERFRLHMGYFATLAEAEEWLTVVREIYPGAWAGEAPGRKLRERATAALAQQAQHAAGPRPHSVPAAAPARVPAPQAPVQVPTLKAAPAPAAPPAPELTALMHRAVAAPRPAAAPTPQAMAPSAPRPAAPAATPPARAATPPPPTPRPAARTPPAAPASPARSPAMPERKAGDTTTKNVFVDSNVKEVLQALTDSSATGETRVMRAPPPPPPAPAEEPKSSLTDTQVLKLLEVRRAEGVEPVSAPPADPAHGSIPMLKPDDTGTRLALKEAVSSNAPVLFAVQLQWSVQPVELDKVPPLAIFSAYTLYTVEGSRDGRRWYGLRLGF
ncbi:MAG: hypothetical protein JO341_08160, partial [Gammaproteobacteria bacterium]|nr:hypothetical protein [Gammaproteobacteria bacterium]